MLKGVKKPGIREVAQAAGVSIGTVSKVFNRAHSPHCRISQATCDTVLRVAGELNYKANYGARLLRGSGSRTIGFAIALPGEHYASYLSDYTMRILNGLGREAQKNGYQLLLINDADYEYYMDINRIDGLVIIDYSLDNNPHLEATRAMFARFSQQKYPYLVVNYKGNFTDLAIPSVGTDNAHGMRLMAEHILRQGYETVGFLGELTANVQYHHSERLHWLRHYLKAGGMVCEERFFVNGSGGGVPDVPRIEGYSHQDGIRGLRYLCDSGNLPRCLVCGNDTIALGVMKEALERGIRVPEDLAVIGFDDLPNAAYFAPALTTVRQPLEEFGRLALDFVIRKMADPELMENRVVAPTFIVRKSG